MMKKHKVSDLVDACELLLDEVEQIEELFISFDHSRSEVEVMWHDWVFQVPTTEIEDTLAYIKYLDDREMMTLYKRNNK